MRRVVEAKLNEEQLERLKNEMRKLYTIVYDNRKLSLSEFVKILPKEYSRHDILPLDVPGKFALVYKKPYYFEIYETENEESRIYLSREVFIDDSNGDWEQFILDGSL